MKGNVVCMTLVGLLCLNQRSSFAQSTDSLKSYDWKTELEYLKAVDKLPAYRDGYVEQISSYDRTGGNDDGFSGKYSFLRKEGDQWVIADFKGPGVINRIWTPTPTEDTLKFYFDGEKEPRLKIRFIDLFSGKVFPFVKPICGNEVGGYYCYLPIPYQKACKITYSGKNMQFYQIQNRDLSGFQVQSYCPQEIESQREYLAQIGEQWTNVNPEIQQFAKDYRSEKKEFTLKPGEKCTFFSVKKGGHIVGFELEMGEGLQGKYKDILLSAVWDDEATEAILAPAADFFGYAYGKPAMRSMLLGSRQGLNYCYIPCPFDRKAQLSLTYKLRKEVQQSPLVVKATVYYDQKPREPEKEGKFYACWRREINPASGQYYSLLSAEGKGHYIGTMHIAQGLRPGMTEFFEGDDSTFIDGKMRMHGTGSEDFYNGGWYALLDRWDRGVSLPIHGSLDYSLPMSRTGAYRFYLTDKMTFRQEIAVGIEHGPTGNNYPVDYTSIAYYYCDRPSVRVMEPTSELRTVYFPDECIYYPQLMEYTLGGATQLEHDRALLVSSRGQGSVRLRLYDIPEGHYRVYMTYWKRNDGADFAVWQRQRMITDWQSSWAEKEEYCHKVYFGELYITPQTNTLTIHTRNRAGHSNDHFEFQHIHLEKIK